jgi:hypothetical protein
LLHNGDHKNGSIPRFFDFGNLPTFRAHAALTQSPAEAPNWHFMDRAIAHSEGPVSSLFGAISGISGDAFWETGSKNLSAEKSAIHDPDFGSRGR